MRTMAESTRLEGITGVLLKDNEQKMNKNRFREAQIAGDMREASNKEYRIW